MLCSQELFDYVLPALSHWFLEVILLLMRQNARWRAAAKLIKLSLAGSQPTSVADRRPRLQRGRYKR